MIDTASMDMDVKISEKTLAMVVMIRTGAGPAKRASAQI
jgi:hypothetical protein